MQAGVASFISVLSLERLWAGDGPGNVRPLRKRADCTLRHIAAEHGAGRRCEEGHGRSVCYNPAAAGKHLLYQLLVGALPLDLKKLAYDDILRRLRDKDVPKPSSRIQTQGDESAITAENRSTDAPSLPRQLRGDPDAVVLKALEKDRKRRYGSPSELAVDLGRYLRNEPVSAHTPSAAYRTRKYVRRNRLAVAMAAAAVLLLVDLRRQKRFSCGAQGSSATVRTASAIAPLASRTS